MPKFIKRRFNNRAKKSKMKSKYFKPVGSTNSLYRNKIPRTLQIATRRPTTTTLRFVKNMTFKVDPQLKSGAAPNNPQNIHLCIAANSIVDILSNTNNWDEDVVSGQIWYSQDFTNYGPPYGAPAVSNITNADGVERFEQQYKHFTVLGSRCQATYETFGTTAGDPGTLYLGLDSAPASNVTPETNMSDINQRPFYKRAQILGDAGNGHGQGARLYQNYSTRKFEGVKDPMDNSSLRGSFKTVTNAQPPVPVAAVGPNEKTFYQLGIVNTIMPNSAMGGTAVSEGILRVKVEYIVRLTEATTLNTVSAPAAPQYIEVYGN